MADRNGDQTTGGHLEYPFAVVFDVGALAIRLRLAALEGGVSMIPLNSQNSAARS